MNKTILIGRLTKNPEFRQTPEGRSVCNFTLAVDRPFKNKDGVRDADFIPVVIWGKAAEAIANSCQKGHRLMVEGRIQIRNFDAKDCTKHWITEIVSTNFEFIERKNNAVMDSVEAEDPAAPVPAV